MATTDHPLLGRVSLDEYGRLRKQYEPPNIAIIGPVTVFTFGSKTNGNDNGPHTKND
jgi:hypothetical protein